MAITPIDIKTRFTQFANYEDDLIQMYLDEAELEISERFGDFKDLALSYLSAHLIVMNENATNGNNSNVSQVTSKSVDGISISYNNAPLKNQDEAFYTATFYGQRYLNIKAKLSIGNLRLV